MKLALLRSQLGLWLRQGISPRRLAFTLALGCVIGCIPVVGVTTLLCAALALLFELNLPAIQAANYAVMPAQILLIVPFVRLGAWLLPASVRRPVPPLALLHASPRALAGGIGLMALQALLAWLVLAIPTVLVMTPALTALLRRVPALASAETSK